IVVRPKSRCGQPRRSRVLVAKFTHHQTKGAEDRLDQTVELPARLRVLHSLDPTRLQKAEARPGFTLQLPHALLQAPH
ncbi:MAG: hypothetical protein ACK6DZ_24410, partial [Acidobacteriota bacterium]